MSEEGQSRRITIWHTTEKRKIVGNAAPMSKNLHEYVRPAPLLRAYVSKGGAPSLRPALRFTFVLRQIVKSANIVRVD